MNRRRPPPYVWVFEKDEYPEYPSQVDDIMSMVTWLVTQGEWDDVLFESQWHLLRKHRKGGEEQHALKYDFVGSVEDVIPFMVRVYRSFGIHLSIMMSSAYPHTTARHSW